MKQEPGVGRLLTVQETAVRLALKPATIRFWILRRIHLEVVKVGRCVRITERSIEDFIERHATRPKDQ